MPKFKPKVKRHIVVHVNKTVGGNTKYVKRRPAKITSIVSGQTVNAVVPHTTETYSSITIFDHQLASVRSGSNYVAL